MASISIPTSLFQEIDKEGMVLLLLNEINLILVFKLDKSVAPKE